MLSNSRRFAGFFISSLLLAGCGGGGNPSSISPVPPLALGRPGSHMVGFAYVPNAFGNNISAYAIKANGSLSPVAGSPFNTGSEPWGATVDPRGKFVFVTNLESDNVSAYAINVTNGALTPVAGSPFATGRTPYFVAVDPKGKFAYVAYVGAGSGISAYTIDAASGALTPVAGSPFKAGSGTTGVAVDPKGKFAYVSNFYDGTVSAYRINASTGALTQLAGSPFAAGRVPMAPQSTLRANSSMWATKTPTMFPLIRSTPAAAR